jgi:hypothetical protein
MLELFIAIGIFFGFPLAIIVWGYYIHWRDKRLVDPWTDLQNWGSQDVDQRKP